MFLHERGRRWFNPWSHPSTPAPHWIEAKTDSIAVPQMRNLVRTWRIVGYADARRLSPS
jgi:hypothetical protein